MEKMDKYKGCLVGGAIGDALGWPVEFLSLENICKKYGSKGIADLKYNSKGVAEITDDTQMTLFTVEGLLRAETRSIRKGICHGPSVVFNAYLRWIKTQGYPEIEGKDWIYDGWLIKHKELFNRRAPGNTCIEALRSGEMGTIENPLNNSKGCGGVMRVAPIGLFLRPENAFNTGMGCAALTHGHPSGYLASGAFSYIIALLIEGKDLIEAVELTIKKLKEYPSHEETSIILEKAILLAESEVSNIKAIEKLGEGWVAEEALAIAVYCSLKHIADFKTAIITAVNHNGDSDSTGAITGNILGTLLGIDAMPEEWINKLELLEVIIEMSEDLYSGHQDTDEWWNKYPGY